MNKKQVQKRVLQNGNLLALSKFSWDEETNTFSSVEYGLVMDFEGQSTNLIARSNSTQTAGYASTQTSGSDSTQTAGDYSTQTAGYASTQKAGYGSTQTAGYGSTHYIDSDSQVKTGHSSVVHALGYNIVIINRNVFEVIQPKKGDVIQICPHGIPGHLVNGKLNGVPHIIADGILSRIVSKKGNIYKVINHGDTKQSYLIEKNGLYAHGKTLKEARDSLVYKISDRDTTAYESMTLDTVLTKEECIVMYRAITGACEEGTKYFVESQDKVKRKYKISEIIEATKGQFGNELLIKFFKGK